MSIVIVAVIVGMLLGVLAYRADMRFRNEDRLPMQWWLNGEVTWSAPRRLALAFIPALAVAVLGILVLTSLTLQPRAGQESQMLPVFIGLGAFVGVQLVHLWLIDRTLRRNAG